MDCYIVYGTTWKRWGHGDPSLWDHVINTGTVYQSSLLNASCVLCDEMGESRVSGKVMREVAFFLVTFVPF